MKRLIALSAGPGFGSWHYPIFNIGSEPGRSMVAKRPEKMSGLRGGVEVADRTVQDANLEKVSTRTTHLLRAGPAFEIWPIQFLKSKTLMVFQGQISHSKNPSQCIHHDLP